MQIPKLNINSVLLILVLIVGVTILLKNHTGEIGGPRTKHTEMTHSDGGTNSEIPTMPGQEAFGTIQEIIGILENDPNTDWSKVNIDALRAHLIDMDELTMNAQVDREDIPGGLKMTVAGTGRTVGAIKRMVTTHNSMTLSTFNAWETSVEETDNGMILTVTSTDPTKTNKIRGLGFIGIMAIGSEHPAHHFMIAKGTMHTTTTQ